MSVWVWLIVAALLILLEAVTFDFILGWFAVGSIFACIMAIIGTPVWAQVLVCVMTGLIFMVLFRKYLLNLALNLKNDKIKKKKEELDYSKKKALDRDVRLKTEQKNLVPSITYTDHTASFATKNNWIVVSDVKVY